MKRMLSLALALSLLLTACAGSGATPLAYSAPPPAVAAANHPALDRAAGDFGLSLLRQTRRAGEDIFLSPFSVLLCLSMAANGGAGETLAQLEALLAGGGTLEELNANCAALLADYAALPEGSALSIANSLWLDGRVRAEDAFVGRCAETYGAGVFQADFTAPAALDDVNAWVKQHTGGHIEKALDALDPATVLALVNAVYFEGKWEQEFDPGDTMHDHPFHREDGTRGTVEMMSSGARTEQYIKTQAERGVLLPYRDGRLALLALLPEEGTTLTDYLDALDGEKLQTLLAGAEEEALTLCLPKFQASWRGSLVPALQAMGLTDAFDPDLADFSAMGTDGDGNGLYVSAVMHGAGVEVDEQGTRAFAFTMAAMSGGGGGAREELIFDRPFVYAIVDTQRGVPLFLGTFEEA